MAIGGVYLTVEPLRPDQYRQVAEWEYGAQSADADWARYAREMEEPKWLHFGLYQETEFAGCLSLERVSRNIAAAHVVTARRKVHPQALAATLVEVMRYLFANGFLAIVAHNPRSKRAGARLAIRCGMVEWGHTPETRYFMMTRPRFNKLWGADGRIET